MDVSRVLSLSLTDFRNFSKKAFSFDEKQTLVLGPNGIGKTNILEALHLLSTGKSFRAKLLADCIREGMEAAHIDAVIAEENDETKLHLTIAKSPTGHTVTHYKRNGAPKRRGDIAGALKSVIFRPEDLELISDGPSFKREYLNDVLVQVSPQYSRSLRDYEKALRHRNKLILQLREGQTTRREFVFWDTLLIKHGDVLTRERGRLVHFINDTVLFPIKGALIYDHSLMTEERLHQYAQAEVAAGKTLVGPHRDSLIVSFALSKNKDDMQDVSRFGSRGQQRMSVLWLKIAALQFIEKETEVSPVLLLDDIFSELDEHNRELVLSLFDNRQVILTSAEDVSTLPLIATQVTL
ncbi:MAG TPA: DNA replication and repair protein RecF [Patescibacteria group bacterium]|nr:DNA replication and repair protein RecF [Patescibacteria group bacterium]